MTRVATWHSDLYSLLLASSPGGFYGKTCPAFCRATEDGILVPYSEGWQSAGMGGPTESLTLNMSEWNHTLAPCPSDDSVCSLSDVLEAGSVPPRYFLSAKACAGILRRAEKREKELPTALHQALQQVAAGLNAPANREAKTA